MTVTSYSTEELVRQGLSKLGEKNISPEFINEAIKWASSDCNLFTGKQWVSGENYYETIQGCAEMLAVCYSLAIQNDKDVRQMNQFTLAMERLKKINETLVATGVIPLPSSGLTDIGLNGISYVPKTTYPMNYLGNEIYAARRKGIISVERDSTTEKFITGVDNSDFV
jgi:hypothetical protein